MDLLKCLDIYQLLGPSIIWTTITSTMNMDAEQVHKNGENILKIFKSADLAYYGPVSFFTINHEIKDYLLRFIGMAGIKIII